jgi:selenocysteine-specific elongation factor
MRYIIVGTAGHIDHGKTSLVRALTGVDTDRFKEEKERGITIDIGFANLDLGDGTRIGFIDVPGHERFVKNMLAGIGGIDLVMLVVAADESVMPQTREHLEICSLLHVRHGFTVITKVDTVDSDLAGLVELEVRDYLKGTFLGEAPIVQFSSATGEGKEELLGTLGAISSAVQARDSSDVFRLPIDRCFTMKGFGTVVTGTLVSGSIGKDDPVVLLPSGQEARIRGVQVHGRAEERAHAGQRTALNLQGVEVRDVERGMVLTVPSLLEPTSVIDCHLELLESASRAITRRKRIRFHVGTAEVMGYVRLLGQDRLEPGETAFAQIRLETEAVTIPGDRFIIRQYSPMITIGGGEVLQVQAGKHRLKDPRVIRRLETLRTCTAAERLMLMIEDRGLLATDLKHLVSGLGLLPDTIRKNLDDLDKAGRIRFLSTNPVTVIPGDVYQSASERAASVVQNFHKKNPLAAGVSREELHRKAFEAAPSIVFQSILDSLVKGQKLETSNEIVHAYGRRATLDAEEEKARDRILTAFRKHGLEVPPANEVVAKLGIDSKIANNILQFMIRNRSLAKINEELVVEQSVIDGVVGQLKERKKTDANLAVGEFKHLTNVTRKYAIPILEYFDRIRVTRRNGNSRLIL